MIRLINWLYFFALWMCLAAGFALLVGDLLTGMGMASAYTLYSILQGKQREENLRMGRYYD